MPAESKPQSNLPAPFWVRWVMRLVTIITLIYLAGLFVSTALRVKFPWDLYAWPESPFMTNMLKLEHGLSLYASPADANSFVYSPGLDYLTFALLKPFGLHLDIRFCRLVNIGVALFGAWLAGRYFRRVLLTLAPESSFPHFWLLGAGVAVLVIFKNFTADVTHPDNLVMMHTVGLLFLTTRALEKRSFAWAVLTMVFAGCGVFAKQILMISFLGPALILARHGAFGRGKATQLFLIGLVMSLAAVATLWQQPFAKFYTWEVLSRQGLHFTQFFWIISDSLHGDRAVLWILGLVSAAILWPAGSGARRVVELWAAVGFFSVCPNALSYVKAMGTWNNLIIFQVWLLLLTWPALGYWLSRLELPEANWPPVDRRLDIILAVLLVLFVSLLMPTRLPPSKAMYACCEAVQHRVSADVQAGRKVLVAHGMMYLLNAGSREIPLDRANSFLELGVAGMADTTKTANRLGAGYYDRIYLVLPEWYDDKVRAEIDKHYVVDEVIPKPQGGDRVELGRALNLIGECKVLSPRRDGGKGEDKGA